MDWWKQTHSEDIHQQGAAQVCEMCAWAETLMSRVFPPGLFSWRQLVKWCGSLWWEHVGVYVCVCVNCQKGLSEDAQPVMDITHPWEWREDRERDMVFASSDGCPAVEGCSSYSALCCRRVGAGREEGENQERRDGWSDGRRVRISGKERQAVVGGEVGLVTNWRVGGGLGDGCRSVWMLGREDGGIFFKRKYWKCVCVGGRKLDLLTCRWQVLPRDAVLRIRLPVGVHQRLCLWASHYQGDKAFRRIVMV